MRPSHPYIESTDCLISHWSSIFCCVVFGNVVCKLLLLQRMFKAHKQKKLRCDPPDNYTYHDRVFANRVNHLIQLTDRNYAATMYKEALKTGFYDLQVCLSITS